MTHDVLAARLEQAMAKDVDHMAAGPNDILWLMTQLACWPERVDPDCTTNDRFLRFSAVATIQSLLADLTAANARVKEAEVVIEPFAKERLSMEPGIRDSLLRSAGEEMRIRAAKLDARDDAIRAARHWLADREGRSDG